MKQADPDKACSQISNDWNLGSARIAEKSMMGRLEELSRALDWNSSAAASPQLGG